MPGDDAIAPRRSNTLQMSWGQVQKSPSMTYALVRLAMNDGERFKYSEMIGDST